jgi:hypothetical protein
MNNPHVQAIIEDLATRKYKAGLRLLFSTVYPYQNGETKKYIKSKGLHLPLLKRLQQDVSMAIKV